MMQNCTYMFKASLIFKKKKEKKSEQKIINLICMQLKNVPWRGVVWRGVAWRGAAARLICALLVIDKPNFIFLL